MWSDDLGHGDRWSLRLVPDELWALVEPLIPRFEPRPQGGGTAPLDARAVFTAIVYVLTSGCSWRDLPPSFGVPFQTAHRRFGQWTKARAMATIAPRPPGPTGQPRPDRLAPRDPGRSVREGQKGGSMTGPSPVDRGKPGSNTSSPSSSS